MLPSKTPSNLDRILHRLRTRRTIKHSIQAHTRQHRQQLLRQLQDLVMKANIHLRMDNLVQLTFGRLDDSGMGVPRVEYADARGEVEEGAAAGCVDVGAGAVGEGQVGEAADAAG